MKRDAAGDGITARGERGRPTTLMILPKAEVSSTNVHHRLVLVVLSYLNVLAPSSLHCRRPTERASAHRHFLRSVLLTNLLRLLHLLASLSSKLTPEQALEYKVTTHSSWRQLGSSTLHSFGTHISLALSTCCVQAGCNIFPSEDSIRSVLPDGFPMEHGTFKFRDKTVTCSAVAVTDIPQLLMNNSAAHAKGDLVFHSNQPHDQLQFGVHGDKGGINTNCHCGHSMLTAPNRCIMVYYSHLQWCWRGV